MLPGNLDFCSLPVTLCHILVPHPPAPLSALTTVLALDNHIGKSHYFSHLYDNLSLRVVIMVMLESIKGDVARTQLCKTRTLLVMFQPVAIKLVVSRLAVQLYPQIGFELSPADGSPAYLIYQVHFLLSLQSCFLSLIKTSSLNIW